MSDIGFLVGDVSRLLRRRFDERARLIGVTRPQWRLLVMLSRHEGMNQGGLADLLDVEPITLCRMIDRLEDAGMVERHRDPADRRAWRIHLSERSRPLLDQLHVVANEVMSQALDGVSDERRQATLTMLSDMRANLLHTAAQTRGAAHG